MYTIMLLNCSKEAVSSTKKAISNLGLIAKIIICSSCEKASKVILSHEVNCIVSDLCQNALYSISFLKEWQETAGNCRNTIILLPDNEEIVFKAISCVHCCDVFFSRDPNQNIIIIAVFLKRHYILHQQLQPLKPLSKNIILVKTSQGEKKCRLRDILYIEAAKHCCTLHTSKESFTISKPLCRIMECELFSEFKQSHRSFLVNTKRILKIDVNHCPWIIYFENSAKHALVSRSHTALFEEYTLLDS